MEIISTNTAGLRYKFVKVSPSNAGYVIAGSGSTEVHVRRNIEHCCGVTLSKSDCRSFHQYSTDNNNHLKKPTKQEKQKPINQQSIISNNKQKKHGAEVDIP